MKPEYEPKDWRTGLAHAMEEMGESIQTCGKTLRFGLFNSNPDLPEEEREVNFMAILREFGDVRRAMERAETLIRQEVKHRKEARDTCPLCRAYRKDRTLPRPPCWEDAP